MCCGCNGGTELFKVSIDEVEKGFEEMATEFGWNIEKEQHVNDDGTIHIGDYVSAKTRDFAHGFFLGQCWMSSVSPLSWVKPQNKKEG